MAIRTPRKKPPKLIELDVLAQAAECLKTLGHPHRLRMVQMLLQDRYTVGQLAEACGIPSPMASGHLRLLQHCGLLNQERAGREVYYRIAQPCLQDIINCIETRFTHVQSANHARNDDLSP
jgi:ArsR family transcriptional regulator, zinc-responsive transcriptional repressor